MRNEIESAVDFVSNILKGRLDDSSVMTFRDTLLHIMSSHYQDHWFPEKPFRGSAYRCIRINHKMDPLVRRAGTQCGLSEEILFAILPSELTVWVDPEEVSYRIGEDGSIGVLFGNDGSSSESDSSLTSSPSPSPYPRTIDSYLMTESPTNVAAANTVRNMEYLATTVSS